MKKNKDPLPAFHPTYIPRNNTANANGNNIVAEIGSGNIFFMLFCNDDFDPAFSASLAFGAVANGIMQFTEPEGSFHFFIKMIKTNELISQDAIENVRQSSIIIIEVEL